MNEQDVLEALDGIAVETLGIPSGELDDSANLLELGLDSLMLIKFGQKIEQQFAVKLEMAWFFKNMPSLKTLARHIVSLGGTVVESRHEPAQTSPNKSTVQTAAPQSSGTSDYSREHETTFNAGDDKISSLFKMQADALESLFDRQLSLLESKSAAGPSRPSVKRGSSQITHDIRGFRLNAEEGLTPEQESFIDSVVSRHVGKTGKSRTLTQQYRHELADWKNTLSFRARLKDTIYPIIADGSDGARFTDLDGNEYIDIALGMGVNFMGHRHPKVVAAVEKRLNNGFELGPQCNITGKAAEKVSRLTGMERVCFCNTGSEAVMIGLRLARARTGRQKVVVFNGAYHGIFDGVLGVTAGQDVEPLSPGTPPGMVEDIVMLDYDSPASLSMIESLAGELAAVLVEPVQSRRPGLQPQTFLRRLRKLTREKGIALIFDEMVNGFRIAPGGAQEYFGIRADIALYGKIIGGGLPVGVITGSPEYLDFIDGGYWQYDNDSLPTGNAIVFGGTFCRHPFSMEAVSAVADYMLAEGAALHARINRLAELLADELNLWFQDEQVPLRVARFGSQFKFESFGQWTLLANPIELDLFFLLLIDAGIYVWERRTCCLSVAHTEDDIRTIITAVKNAVNNLREGGFAFRLEHGAPELFHEVTSVQKRIFAAMQRENGQAPYHMPAAWRIRGDLDMEWLEICLGEIIKRHESLRSGFRIAGGRLVRTVVDECRFFVERIDPGGRSPEQIVADFLRPFDLEQPPLMRVGVASLDNGEYLLVFDSLHIVVDGIALATFTQELNAFYNGAEPPDSGASYTQYERFMREFEEGEVCAGQQSYWTEALADAPPPITFSHRKASASAALNTGHVRTVIPPDILDRIRKTAALCGVTPYMFMLAVYTVLVRSLAGAAEMVVGVATTGRPEKRFEATVGMFVNTLPLRLAPEKNQSFREFLGHVREVCADAYQHQDIPYELIAAKTGDTVGTMFTYEVADERSLELAGLVIEEMEAPIPGAMFDFSLDAIEKNNAVHLDFEFDSGVLEESSVCIWADCFSGLIERVCADPDVRVGEVPFMPSHQPDESHFTVSGEKREYTGKRTVIDLFEKAVAENPGAAAVIDGSGGMTYAELDMLSRRIADVLQTDYHFGPECLAAISAHPSASVVAAILGILRAGGAFLPLEHNVPKARIERILETADIYMLIGDGDLFDALNADRKAGIETLVHSSEGRQLKGAAGPESGTLAYVIYTSGSTGVPKGCEIEHASLHNYLAWAMEFYFSDRSAGNFCLTSPLAFDMSLMTLFVPLCQGTTLRIPPLDTNPAEALALALSPGTETDVLNLTPSHVRMIAGLDCETTNARIAVVGGEMFRPEDAAALLALNPAMKIYNEYGPTETTIGCTAKQIMNGDVPTIGRPIFNTTACIVDAEMRPLPPGAWGELCIGGDGLARGYRNLPESTKERFTTLGAGAGRLYRTGDIARLSADGDIELGGRIDGQIKIGGHRIEPGEIESALMTCDGVEEAAVVFDGTLTAFVGGNCDSGTVKTIIAELLPSYMVPQRIETIGSLPVLSSGKTDRKKLLSLAHETAETTAPADAFSVESPALAIMREISGNIHLRYSDNFFTAGGNSLDAVAVVARCRKELGLNIGLREFFAVPTAETIDRCNASGHESGALHRTSLKTGIPQTSGQKQIWLASQKSGSAYNMTETFILEGAIDADLLKASFGELVRRHEILRTTFSERNGELLQDVRDYSPSAIHFDVLSFSGDDDIEKAVTDYTDRESRFVFDLAHGPLMRVMVFVQNSGRHYCLLNIHHIVTDGWSAALMLEDVSRIYRAGGKIPDDSLWQYRDFAAWHNRYLTGHDADNDLTYWKDALQPPLHRVSLPGRNASAHAAALSGARPAGTIPLDMNEELVHTLTGLARENGATLFMALLAGLAALLHQRTSESDIIIGTPSAGRVLPELERIPGYFLNTLPLRMRFSGETTFRELIGAAKVSASDAFAHQLYPFDMLADSLDSSRADGRNPFFDVMLILQNTSDYRFDLPGVVSQRFYSPGSREAKFEIMIEMETKGNILGGIIEYDASLYDNDCIEALASDYLKTLDRAVRTPDAPVSTLFTLLSGEDESSKSRFLKSLSDVSEEF